MPELLAINSELNRFLTLYSDIHNPSSPSLPDPIMIKWVAGKNPENFHCEEILSSQQIPSLIS